MHTKNEMIEILRDLFEVEYGNDDSPYPMDDDFCERLDELVELIDNLEPCPLKQGLIDALDENLYPNLPFGEWTHYDTINSVIAGTLAGLLAAAEKTLE